MANSIKAPSLRPRNDLTADHVRSILDYDPLTGIFRWKVRSDVASKWADRWNRRYAGSIAGGPRTGGDILIRIFKRHYAAHRLAWLYMTRDWPTNDIDHKNTIKSDNRFENLRPATDTQNNCNVGPRRHNTSGYKGVTKHKNKWVAQICYRGNHIYLGIFTTREEAAAAYREAARQLHGEFARS